MYLVGFFKELDRDFQEFPHSIIDVKEKLDPNIKLMVLNYLTLSTGIFDWLETVRDYFDTQKTLTGGSCIYSDEEWIFRKDLAYYVKKYNVSLPSEFTEKIIGSHGVPPLSQVQLRLDEIMGTINQAYDGKRHMFID